MLRIITIPREMAEKDIKEIQKLLEGLTETSDKKDYFVIVSEEAISELNIEMLCRTCGNLLDEKDFSVGKCLSCGAEIRKKLTEPVEKILEEIGGRDAKN